MVETSQIGRRLARKRAHKEVPPTLFQGGVIGDVIEAVSTGAHRADVGSVSGQVKRGAQSLSAGNTAGASSDSGTLRDGLTPMTGAQLLAYWDAEDVGGVYADKSKYPGNAQETARALREREEARE
jgi:hypothetical protein